MSTTAATNVTTTHHSLAVEPWAELHGGVCVLDWGDCVDAEPQPLLLLRDRAEVERLRDALLLALDTSEGTPR